MITKDYKLNESNFVLFENRNFEFKGDTHTWARIKNKKVTVQKAKRGIISKNFHDEMNEFCHQYGLIWNHISCGQKITTNI